MTRVCWCCKTNFLAIWFCSAYHLCFTGHFGLIPSRIALQFCPFLVESSLCVKSVRNGNRFCAQCRSAKWKRDFGRRCELTESFPSFFCGSNPLRFNDYVHQQNYDPSFKRFGIPPVQVRLNVLVDANRTSTMVTRATWIALLELTNPFCWWTSVRSILHPTLLPNYWLDQDYTTMWNLRTRGFCTLIGSADGLLSSVILDQPNASGPANTCIVRQHVFLGNFCS